MGTHLSSDDMVSNPPHYKTMVPGVECIEVTENFNFCLGNAIKYIWRADYKGNPIQDLEKAAWYVQREIDRRKREMGDEPTPDRPTSAQVLASMERKLTAMEQSEI